MTSIPTTSTSWKEEEEGSLSDLDPEIEEYIASEVEVCCLWMLWMLSMVVVYGVFVFL